MTRARFIPAQRDQPSMPPTRFATMIERGFATMIKRGFATTIERASPR
jgi:hypothetical protein